MYCCSSSCTLPKQDCLFSEAVLLLFHFSMAESFKDTIG